jgi:acetyl-CoA acetyltransferase
VRPVAIVGYAQHGPVARSALNDAEMVMPAVTEALARAGLGRKEVGFTCSGSSDFLIGTPFSFVGALDAVGAWPPIRESHVEMDGAWALYEAWVRLQHGDVDTALVYAFGRSSHGDVADVLVQQLDPYYLAPLGCDATSLAALQARVLIDRGRASERDFAEVAARALGKSPAQLLDAPYTVAPLRAHDCGPPADASAAIVLAARGEAKRLAKHPAWITGIDHRIEPHGLGVRDLGRSISTEIAARAAGLPGRNPERDEIYAPYSSQELILREALELDAAVEVNRSGGALKAHPLMVAGLVRLGEAAQPILDGTARSTVAHATSGPCLQQNLVCVLGDQP